MDIATAINKCTSVRRVAHWNLILSQCTSVLSYEDRQTLYQQPYDEVYATYLLEDKLSDMSMASIEYHLNLLVSLIRNRDIFGDVTMLLRLCKYCNSDFLKKIFKILVGLDFSRLARDLIDLRLFDALHILFSLGYSNMTFHTSDHAFEYSYNIVSYDEHCEMPHNDTDSGSNALAWHQIDSVHINDLLENFLLVDDLNFTLKGESLFSKMVSKFFSGEFQYGEVLVALGLFPNPRLACHMNLADKWIMDDQNEWVTRLQFLSYFGISTVQSSSGS